MSTIQHIHARQILDSRGTPTLEVEVTTQEGIQGRAAIPSGASKGQYEALELRDGDEAYYNGQGVSNAIKHVNTTLRDALIGVSIFDQSHLDRIMIDLDGTPNKSKLGANALLGVSVATAQAASKTQKQPLYRYLGGEKSCVLPTPMINVLNGGMHADNDLDFQEFMIMPVKATSFSEALHIGVTIFQQLGRLLKIQGLSTNVGDEGGYAPQISSNEKAIELVIQAIEKAGFRPGEDVFIALDIAASEFYNAEYGYYHFRKTTSAKYTSTDLVDFWKRWTKQYPIISIEDGMAEDDWEGWRQLTAALGEHVQLVGDDLFVTQTERIQKGIDIQAANAVLIKMNQVGTLTETMEAIKLATNNNYKSIMSHRSGETEDTTIADLAVAFTTGQIKTGSVSRSDRTAKYNQLLRIEEYLGKEAQFAGHPLAKNNC